MNRGVEREEGNGKELSHKGQVTLGRKKSIAVRHRPDEETAKGGRGDSTSQSAIIKQFQEERS